MLLLASAPNTASTPTYSAAMQYQRPSGCWLCLNSSFYNLQRCHNNAQTERSHQEVNAVTAVYAAHNASHSSSNHNEPVVLAAVLSSCRRCSRRSAATGPPCTQCLASHSSSNHTQHSCNANTASTTTYNAAMHYQRPSGSWPCLH